MNRMIEVARNSVQIWDVDEMGHMNIQFYVDRAADGLAALGHYLGLGRGHAHGGGELQLAVRNQHIRFLSERRIGSPFYLRAGVLDADAHILTVYQEMVGANCGTVAATFTMELELRNAAGDGVCSLPASVRERALRLHVERPEHGQPKGLAMGPPRPALTLHEAESMGLVPTFQGQVRREQCDMAGHLSLRHFMGIITNAIPQLPGLAHGHAPDTGGATLELCCFFRRFPMAGDLLAVRSGLTRIGNKTLVWCHWLFDLETGEAVASAEAVGVSLDLTRRKAMAIPEASRAHLESLLVDGLHA